MTNWAGVRCACCGAINASGTPAAAHQRKCNGALWRTRAHAAERRAAVLAALLGCAGEVAWQFERAMRERAASGGQLMQTADMFTLLATDPHELMRLVPECKAIIEHALAAAGYTLEDLDVLEETT